MNLTKFNEIRINRDVRSVKSEYRKRPPHVDYGSPKV